MNVGKVNSQGCGRGVDLAGMRKGNGGDLVSAHHAERLPLSDRADSLLAAGVHAADEGAGCLKRREVMDEEGERGDSTKLGGMASTGLPDHGRV